MTEEQFTRTYLRFFLTRLRPIPGEMYKRLGGTFAIASDSLADGARQAVRVWLHADDGPVSTIPVDALQWLLRTNGLPTYRSDFDSPAGYVATVARLFRKWESHARSGTPGGLTSELNEAGFIGAVVAPDDAPEYSGFWVDLPGVDDTEPEWGSFNWGESAWQVSGITPERATLLAQIVHFWQPARSRFYGLKALA